jgi:phage terminase small subunit
VSTTGGGSGQVGSRAGGNPPPSRSAAGLNPKQARFVAEYLVDLNGKQAAIRAGYSPRSAEVTASKLLRVPKVAEAVRRANERRLDRVEVTADTVLRELLLIARTDLAQAYDENGHLRPIHDIPEECRRAIAGVKVFEEFDGVGADRVKVGEVREVKFWDKPKSLELLGKHLKLFTEVVESTATMSVNLREITDEEWEELSRLKYQVRDE